MNKKAFSRGQWSRSTPETRASMRNLYRTMREISHLDRVTAGCYVAWAVSAANLERVLAGCSHG